MTIPKQCRSSACSAVQFAVAVYCVWPVVQLGAQTHEMQHEQKLGTISFPNSGNTAAQAPFERGVKLYYSFEYESAAEAFREAQRADPSFALAYWGEALTCTHQVWNEQNLGAGRAALAKLAAIPVERRGKARTEREKMYMDLAEALYGDGAKQQRDTLFNAAAERLSTANPADDEAKMFHALGLLGLNQGVRDFTTYMQAGAIAEDVLRRHPDHPAAAHFVIHAFDDPVHAPLGLWAARAYSKIAPAAMHAQHMTSHIFVALGMWDDVISQNVIASQQYEGVMQAGHYTWWLGYGYGQAGRYTAAKAHLEVMRKNFGVVQRRGEGGTMVRMRAHYLIDTERWTDDAASWKLAVPPLSFPAATDSFLTGFAALRRGDPATAERIGAFLSARAGTATPGSDDQQTVAVLDKELRAAIASAAGRSDDAIAFARTAAAAEDGMPFEFGPPQFVKPTHELLGEVLLAAGKPGDAKAAFQRALARMPGRSRSLIGLARAASASGDKTTAELAVAQLKSNWHAADKNVPELAELTKLLAATNK